MSELEEKVDAAAESKTFVPFPITIALVGAPGSGKSLVAEEYKRLTADYYEEHDSELVIVPNAARTFEERYEQPAGIFADFYFDLRCNFARYELEQNTVESGKSFITCGTTLDNLAHSAVNMENLARGLQTDDTQRRLAQGQITMQALTWAFMERFRFTFGFYVPKPGASLVLPGMVQVDDTDNYDKRVDGALRQIFQNFNFRIQLLEGGVEEQAKQVFDTVKRVMENGPDDAPPEALQKEGEELISAAPEGAEVSDEVAPAVADTLSA